MINVKETLQNLHKEFPEMSSDDLFKILDCCKEDYVATLNKPHYNYKSLDRPDNTLYTNTITC